MQANRRHTPLFPIAVFLIIAAASAPVWGTNSIDKLLPNNESLEIPVKKSSLVKLKTPVDRVSIVAPEIADVNIVDPKQILITAASVGETSLLLWTKDGQTRAIDVKVVWNTKAIQDAIQAILPDEAIEVVSMEGGAALKGEAHSLDAADRAMEIAQSYVPKVINMMTVPGLQQVLLKVKIAEVASSFRDEMGFNFIYHGGSIQGGSLLGDLITGDMTQGGTVDMSDVVTLFFGLPNSDVKGFLQALKSKGWIHMLAQPNLIARSGETANFLAGGEFPIPVVQGGASTNAVTIEYKEFGVRLQFTPTVMDAESIHLDISPEVSDLDFSTGVKMGGFMVPSLITRRAHTVIDLKNGQTFAIAGLMSQNKQKNTRKVPGAGDIPILGALFSGKEISQKETELLIMVTPHLVAPLENGETMEMPTPPELVPSLTLPKEEAKKESEPANKKPRSLNHKGR
ncbi:MAG: type II and III secretion system protein family protein [Candidatus Omnitrophota bacterium]